MGLKTVFVTLKGACSQRWKPGRVHGAATRGQSWSCTTWSHLRADDDNRTHVTERKGE